MGVKTHVVPRHVRETSCWFSSTATMDEIEMAAAALPEGPAGVWARSVVDRHVERSRPALVAAGTTELLAGRGVRKTGVVRELVPSDQIKLDRTRVPLDEKTAASVRRMLAEDGIDKVILRPYAPIGVIRPAHGDTTTITGAALPEGSHEVAIVDELDKTAVLELIAVAPGPTVFRRHDGDWHEDEGWVLALQAVQPPPMVQLTDEAMLASVVQQVDEATSGQPFKPLKRGDQPVVSSAFVQQLCQDDLQAGVDAALLAAVDVGELKNPVGTERLRRYWLFGKGAAKIRWGTPGAWSRCRRLLSKYMPPYMTPGYCTNLSQRLGGQGVATHVGTRGKRAAKRALKKAV